MTTVTIGRDPRRTVDLGAELTALADDLAAACDLLNPSMAGLRIAALSDDTRQVAAATADGSDVCPGDIHRLGHLAVDLTDLFDDLGEHAALCGRLGLCAARLHRLADALAVVPLREAV